ncbi:MAG TPA: plastocyanin/azurin family copper-binding protein [Anaerolineales bacterium]|nr:plastocyanin/azurin family copper-binding protein [Anaerolineales bacterium]
MKRILMMAVLFSLTLVACGGGGGVSNKINVTMTDFQFQPSQFTVPAGQEITLNATNNGAVVHNFVVMKKGTSAGDSFDDEDTPNVYWEVELQPGGSANTTFTAPTEPGDYEVVCRTAGHIAAGMTAKLTVVSGE